MTRKFLNNYEHPGGFNRRTGVKRTRENIRQEEKLAKDLARQRRIESVRQEKNKSRRNMSCKKKQRTTDILTKRVICTVPDIRAGAQKSPESRLKVKSLHKVSNNLLNNVKVYFKTKKELDKYSTKEKLQHRP